MTEIKNIDNKDEKVANKTGEDFFFDRREQTRTTTDKSPDSHIEDDLEDRVKTKNSSMTPAEISRKKYYDSQKKKEDAKTAILNVLKFLIPIGTSIVIGLLAIFGAIQAYKLNNIAEPIGGMKVEIQYIKENIQGIKNQLGKPAVNK